MSVASVSTWSLHSLLGTCAVGRPGDSEARLMESQPGEMDLLDVPEELAKHGFTTMELCHFHIPRTDAKYLATLRKAIEDHGIELWSLLIDDGDITHPETGDRDRQWIAEWIDRASALGARCVRVIGGRQPASAEVLATATEQLGKLAAYASERGVRVLTENWMETFATPAALTQVLDELQHEVGLCFDFGNWSGPRKYNNLAEIAPYANSCHAKCQYTDGTPDAEDFRRCLDITREANFHGPYTLVHGEPGRVWESLAEQRDLLTPYL